MITSTVNKKKSFTDRFLDSVEKVCNKLPSPFTLFVCLFIITAITGALISNSGIELIHSGTGKAVASKNLFSEEGMTWLLTNMVTNFSAFAPFGLVLTMTLGIGMCEESGLISALIKKSMRNVPAAIVPYAIAFIGVMGNIASDSASILIPPLAALAYLGVGKHPIAGLICGYAGAQAGFTANLMVTSIDTLLAGITNTSINGFLPGTTYQVEVVCNWYFMIASTFLCSLVIGFVTTYVVEKRLGEYTGSFTVDSNEDISPIEKKGLRNTGIAALMFCGLIAAGMFLGNGFLLNEGSILGSLLLKGLVAILFFFFFVTGTTYGFTVGKFKEEKDLPAAMGNQMKTMSSYIIFCFAAGQFIALFNWTQLGTLMAISGANILKGVGFTGIPMILSFIILCTLVNIIVFSSSAKWAMFAPIFVPMFMLLGYDAGFTQLLYRIGDTPTNCLTPMSPYIWMVLSVAQTKYNKDATIGTMVSNLMPITIVLQIAWMILVVIWMLSGIPFGPGTNVYLPAGVM